VHNDFLIRFIFSIEYDDENLFEKNLLFFEYRIERIATRINNGKSSIVISAQIKYAGVSRFLFVLPLSLSLFSSRFFVLFVL
jgi:hypothetical protein